MSAEFKKNFVISVVLHGIAFAGFFLAMAFVPTPRLDVPVVMEIVGGGGGGPEIESEPPPPAPPEPAPPPPAPPKQEERVQKTEPVQELKPKDEDVVVPKEQPRKEQPKKVEEKPKVEKKVEVKKPDPPKPEVKKETKPKADTKPAADTKPKLVSRAQFDKHTKQSKTPAKPDSRYSSDAIRSRLAKNLPRVESYGSGPGPANGLSGKAGTDFEAYCSLLSRRLYQVWDIPGQATTSMSTVVVIRVTSDGTLTFVKILRPSGSTAMDESAVAAVYKLRQADPLPPSLGSVRELTVTFQPLGA